MPANRLAASKASYPMATTKINIIQSTPPPRPSCLLVVIEASVTLQVCPAFLASADEAGRLGLGRQIAHRSYLLYTYRRMKLFTRCATVVAWGPSTISERGQRPESGARPEARPMWWPKPQPTKLRGLQ